MLSGISQGLLLGFIITAVPGAVVLEAARRALAKRAVMSFLAGNFIGTGIIISVTLLGLSSVLRHAMWSHIFYFFSGTTLLLIGVSSILSGRRQRNKSTAKRFRRLRLSANYRALAVGVILAAVNPIAIVFWVTTIGRYFSSHDNSVQIAANCTAIVLGGAIFYGLLLTMTTMTHRKLSPQYITVATHFFGLAIVLYGGFVLSKV